MKKIALASLLALLSLNMMALSKSKLRDYARFISDRMAYELDLTPMQYDDCYEINYDFLYSVNPIMDDVVLGYIDAIDRYYDYLDYRNEDLRHVLTARQYERFLDIEYFFRPIYTNSSGWQLRVYNVYTNHSFFYFDRPSIYFTYSGGHSRIHFSAGYYLNRYDVALRYRAMVNIRALDKFRDHRRMDFGANIRPRTQAPRPNYYPNANQQHRTSDPRYRNERPNRNSPQINNRNQPAPPPPAPRTGGGGVVRSGRR
ncbi:MAG: hypothetical protein J1F13_04775 [Prevotellaceae bacterium]|nr:hypothetical protein [Prevotellaceae bacterium]